MRAASKILGQEAGIIIMKRREFTKSLGSTALYALLSGTVGGKANPKRENRPNILFIMTDQQSAHMMSCTGNKWLYTPAMDRLANSGIRFESAYVTNPICVPTRFSLQSGLMPSAIGMRLNSDDKNADVSPLMIQQSLGNLFKNAGYETVFGGKVHLPHKMRDLEGLGYRDLTRDERRKLAEASVRFIKGKHEKPFLLFVSLINPHDICYMGINEVRRAQGRPPENNIASRVFEKLFDPIRKMDDVDSFIEENCPSLPDNFEIAADEPGGITETINTSSHQWFLRGNWTKREWRLHRWAYMRLTERVDEEIGIVLNALKEAGLEEETLVVFTSDHGDMSASHQLVQKGYHYEEAVRVPFLMSFKGTIPSGVVNTSTLVSNGLDVLPTLCDYAGIEVPPEKPGKSLKPLIESRFKGPWRESIGVELSNGRVVRTERYKYTVYESGEHRIQLVDLKNDPGEMTNLANDKRYQEVVEQHHQLLKEWIARTGDTIGAKYM